MSTLRDLAEEHTGLGPADIDQLHRLAGDWQLLSDLSFADLLLWVPVKAPAGEPREFLCVAQVRPTTAPTAYQDDQVGKIFGGSEVAHLDVAFTQERIWREGDPVWYGDTPARHEAIPVRRRDENDHEEGYSEVIAVIGRDTNLSTARTPSQLELNYLTTADDLAQMVSDGTFPPVRPPGEATSAPRVGDGLIRLDASGKVTYASPNAQSAYRRLGFNAHLVGEELAHLSTRLAADPLEGTDVAERIRTSLRGEFPPRMEFEARGATVLTRSLPLLPAGVPIGALVLVRDVTEVRRRDRALMTKDATIREIHHRVKNNLQTVAALLRLQARRMTEPAARAALEESVRRVASIAVVHETLAGSREDVVDVDDVLDQVLPMLGDLTSVGPAALTRRTGAFGELPAAAATPLVLAVTELLHNAAEHAFPDGEPGSIELVAERDGDDLVVRVRDNGRGLPDGFDPAGSEGLGLQIVRTLVTSELGGTLTMRRPDGHPGTEAVLSLPGAGRLPRR